jgi:hypothetical protein
VDEPRILPPTTGCGNPLCPSANWSQRHLPRWQLALEDGQITEFAACNEACAHLVSRFFYARLGRTTVPYARLHGLEPVAVH